MADIHGETVIFSCKPKLSAFIPFALAGLAVFSVCAVLGVWQLGAAALSGLIAYRSASLGAGGVTVTDIRVICGKVSVPIKEITGADCSQSPAGKLFRYGTVTISTSRGILAFRGLPQTELLRNEISKQVDLYHFRQTCRQAELARKMMEE